MSDTICSQLTTIPGIESAASSPTGLFNHGPEGYAIQFDPAETDTDAITKSLCDALQSPETQTAVSLNTSQIAADDPHRDRYSPTHPRLPVLHVTVSYAD